MRRLRSRPRARRLEHGEERVEFVEESLQRKALAGGCLGEGLVGTDGAVGAAREPVPREHGADAGVPGVRGVTGRGLMLGVVVDDAPAVTARMLQRGWLVLPCGEHSEAIGLTPPLTISPALLDGAVAALAECIG